MKTYSVLVIDDEEQICKIIRVFLNLSSKVKNVVVAKDSIEAMLKLNNQQFDLIMVDKSMPHKSGLEFVENLRKSLKHQNSNILLISGCLTKEDTLNAMKLDIKEILVKPFNRQRLMEKFDNIFN